MKRADRIEQGCQALESGKYKQTRYRLRETDDKGNESFCCLGVFCDLNGVDIDVETNGERLNVKMMRLLGINSLGQFEDAIKYRGSWFGSLASLNDSGVRFKTIARIIREQLKAGNFRKPRF